MEGLCSSLYVCHDVTLTVNLNIIVLFLPCVLALDFSKTVFRGLDFFVSSGIGKDRHL